MQNYQKTTLIFLFFKIRTHKESNHNENVNLFHQYVTSSSQFQFNDDQKQCEIIYKNTFKPTFNSSRILFDDSSSSAYSDFKKNLEEHLNSKNETEYYPNGRLMYVGSVLYKKDNDTNQTKRVPHGKGTLYFDGPGDRVKYSGEFEEGHFDGAGTFYSLDGKLRIVSNNISCGIPTQKGKLYCKFKQSEDYIDINFSELWDKIGVSSRANKKSFVMSNDFVPDVALKYWSNRDYSLEELVFKDKTVEEKQAEFWNQLKIVTNQVNQNHQVMIELMQKQNNCIGIVGILVLLNMFLLLFKF